MEKLNRSLNKDQIGLDYGISFWKIVGTISRVTYQFYTCFTVGGREDFQYKSTIEYFTLERRKILANQIYAFTHDLGDFLGNWLIDTLFAISYFSYVHVHLLFKTFQNDMNKCYVCRQMY